MASSKRGLGEGEPKVRPVTEAELQTYWEHGVVKLPGLVSEPLVGSIIGALDEQIANPSRWGGSGKQRSDRCFGVDNETLCEYLLNETLGQNAARAMRAPWANFFFDHMFLFEPDSPVEKHYWHQDLPYWPIEGEHIVSFWLSLTACTPESAALKFVPGTQNSSGFYRPKSFDGSSLQADLGTRGELAVAVPSQFLDTQPPAFHESAAEYGVLEFSYDPGDAVMFHSRIVHSSGGNRSTESRRLAYSVRFFGPDARHTLRRGVFQDPALLPEEDEPFVVGTPMQSRRWPRVFPTP